MATNTLTKVFILLYNKNKLREIH